MKLHTSLTEPEIRAALARAQASGEIPHDIEFDQFTQGGSRTHQHAWDVHLATRRRDTRADGRTRRAAAYYGVHGQLRAASRDEWGAFLAEFFANDPNAKAGPYKSKGDFHARTRYAYAQGHGELPPYSPDEPEPYRGEPDTRPTTQAMLPAADILKRIDDTLSGCWVNTLTP